MRRVATPPKAVWVAPRSVELLDLERRDSAVAAFKHDYETFEWAQTQEDRGTRKLLARSPFMTMSVLQLAEALRVAGWRTNDEILEFLKKKHDRVFATQANEDGMQRLRKRERDSVHKKPGMHSLFATLIDRPILNGAHKFVVPKPEVPTALKNSVLPLGAFTSKVSDASIRTHFACASGSQCMPNSGTT